MNWENPVALLAGITIPAIIVLWMLKPRRPRLRVPSLMLWPASLAERQSSRPWQRLRNHPLLWLQVAIAALLVLSAARPFLPAEAAGRHLVVLLDASGSMRARDVAPDRFASARASVVDLARSMGPDQQMTIVRMDARPRVLVAGARSAGQVESTLASEQASYGPPDVAATVALASGLTQGQSEWVLVGDGGITLPEGVRRPEGTGFRHIAIGSGAANVAITGLALRRGDSDLTVQAGMRNFGGGAVSGRLLLLAEGRLIGAQEWRIEQGEEVHLMWSHLPTGPMWYEAVLTGVPVDANGLEADDHAWAVPAATTEGRVLLVTSGNSFLERILSIQGNLRTFKAGPADWAGISPEQGGSYPLTVLDRLWPDLMPAGSALVVGPPVGEEFRPEQVWSKGDHPLLRHVDWSEVRVAKARRLQLDDSWERVIDSDGGPLLAIRTDSGRRQAVLSFELGQSDLALRTAFPVLMANLLDWLLPRPEEAPRTVAPGSSITLEPTPLAERLWVEGSDGARFDLAPPWPPVPFTAPAPGLYRVIQDGGGGRQESHLVALPYDAAEADLAPRAVGIPSAGGGAGPPVRGSFPFWPGLAGALVLVSMIEWWVDARGR